jgi:hypothetical protein
VVVAEALQVGDQCDELDVDLVLALVGGDLALLDQRVDDLSRLAAVVVDGLRDLLVGVGHTEGLHRLELA